MELSSDPDGDAITSFVVLPAENKPTVAAGPRLTRNQQTMLALLKAAGAAGLTIEDWNTKAKEVGVGTKRAADLYDLRESLKAKRLVHLSGKRWIASSSMKAKSRFQGDEARAIRRRSSMTDAA